MSFDVFSLATDENLENNGTEFPIGQGTTLLIARAGNRAYGRSLNKHLDKRRVEIEIGPKASESAQDAASKASDEIMADVMAESILLGWKNLSFKGALLEYSVENAKKLLAVKDFRKMVATFSEQADAFKLKEEVESGKD